MLLTRLSRFSTLSELRTGSKHISCSLCMGNASSTNRKMASSAKASSTLLSGSEPATAFIYGTAWKKDQTKRLVKEALVAGFRKVDTAAQPRHYQESLVGEALREAFKEGIVERKDIYVRHEFFCVGFSSFLKSI